MNCSRGADFPAAILAEQASRLLVQANRPPSMTRALFENPKFFAMRASGRISGRMVIAYSNCCCRSEIDMMVLCLCTLKGGHNCFGQCSGHQWRNGIPDLAECRVHGTAEHKAVR